MGMSKTGVRRVSLVPLPRIDVSDLAPQLQRFDEVRTRDRDQRRGLVRESAGAERERRADAGRLVVRRRRAGKDERRVGGFSTGAKMAARTI